MSQSTFLFGLVILLGLGLVVTLVLLAMRRAPAQVSTDPALALLQQQLSRLGEQVAESAAAVPREVGAHMGTLLGQVGARLAENAQAVQRVGSDTGRLIADLNLKLGDLGRSSQQILGLGQDIRSLQQIFSAPKSRGAFGEISLNALLEQSFPSENLGIQVEFKSGDRVDAS